MKFNDNGENRNNMQEVPGSNPGSPIMVTVGTCFRCKRSNMTLYDGLCVNFCFGLEAQLVEGQKGKVVSRLSDEQVSEGSTPSLPIGE